MKLKYFFPLIILLPFIVTACDDDASIASRNVSKAADNFEVMRRVIFYNTWTGDFMLTIEGRCSLEIYDKKFVTICKTGPSTYKKDYLLLNGQVSAFAEQMEPIEASVYHHRKTWKPQSILPNIDFRGSTTELLKKEDTGN